MFRMKRFWGVVILVVAGCLLLFGLNGPLDRCERRDMVSFYSFEREVSAEILNAIDAGVDPFVDDLVGVVSLGHVLIGQRDERVAELWDKHFGGIFQEIVDGRAQLLIGDLWEHNQDFLSEVSVLGVEVQGFDRRLRAEMVRSFQQAGFELGGESLDRGVVNLGLAVGVSMAVEIAISKICKANVYTTLLAVALAVSVEHFLEKKLQGDVKDKLRVQLRDKVEEYLKSRDGLVVRFANEIRRFHEVRRKEYASVSSYVQR